MIKQNHHRYAVMIFLSAFLYSITYSVPGFSEPLDRIVAIVEAQNVSSKKIKTRIITQSEIDEAIAPLLARLRKSGEKVDHGKIEKNALDELILNALRQQKAEQFSIQVTENDIKALVANIERNNKIPPGSLPQALRSQGINPEQYRLGLANKLLQSRLIGRIIRPLVSVSDEEVENLYLKTTNSQTGVEELRLGQILLEIDPATPDYLIKRIFKKAVELSARLKKGESLTTLASQYSNDPSGLDGGDMGWFKRGQLIPAIENAVFNLNQGGVTPPLRSPQGFHIFTVIERRVVQQETKNSAKFRVKARHILLPVGKGDDDKEALQEILMIRDQFLSGEASFIELAKQYSKDGTAPKGGDLGWFGGGIMVPAFEKAAFAIEVGRISKPVRTSFGWHLIMLDDKQTVDPGSLAAKYKELKERVIESKLQLRYKQWLRDLRARAFVEFR